MTQVQYTVEPQGRPQAQQPVAFFPPLPRSVLRCAQTVVYDAMQMRQYAMRFTELLAAAPAPQPAQGVPEVGFGNMPYSPYLFGGLRFKMNFDKSGNATNFHGVESSLQGAWVALVDATDNRHLQSAQPVAPPLTLEQILDIVKKLDETPDMSHVDVLKTFARAIEAAHGIREVK